MSENKTYEASARRDGRWWFIDVHGLDVSGQARDVDEIEEVAREVAGLVLDINPDYVNVNVTIELPENVRITWEESKQLFARAREEEGRAAALARQAVEGLRKDGLTQKEAGRVLGLSPSASTNSKVGHARRPPAGAVERASWSTDRSGT